MAFKLKSGNTTSFKLMGGAEKSPSKAKKLFGEATTPAKDYDVSKGSHNHPHDAPSKMYGKMKSPAKDTNPHTGFNPPHTEKNHGKKQGLKQGFKENRKKATKKYRLMSSTRNDGTTEYFKISGGDSTDGGKTFNPTTKTKISETEYKSMKGTN